MNGLERKYIIDTNFILNNPHVVETVNSVITTHVSREFESLERKGNDDLLKKIRDAKRAIINNIENITFDFKDYNVSYSDKSDNDYVDNKLIQCCIENDYGLATNDVLLKIKALTYNIPLLPEETFESNDHALYTGVLDFLYNEHVRDDQENLANLYKGNNVFKVVNNEYICVWDINKPKYDRNGKLIGYEHVENFVCKNSVIKKVYYDKLESKFLGEIKPVNAKQKLAFHMLQDKESTIKVIQGGFGVGKDFLMISHAVSMLENPNSGIDKIMWVRNNVEVKDTNPIGFLPDGKMEKLLPFAKPLSDHLGGMDGLVMFVEDGKVEIEHLGFMRGRDIKNAIIYVTECENNTKEHMQLLIGRVGEGSQLWCNGDTKQTDEEKFRVNSGLDAIKKLAGERKFALVTLDKIERSETARLADLLD